MEASTAVENATAAANGEGDRPPFSLELTQDQKDIRDWVHGFAADVVRPAADEWDEREETPWPIIQEAAKIGLYGFESLAQFFADPTGLTLPIVNEELFWGDAGIGMAIMGTALAVAAIFGQGTPRADRRVDPAAASARADDVKVAAFCVSRARRRLRRLRRPHAAPSTTRPRTSGCSTARRRGPPTAASPTSTSSSPPSTASSARAATRRSSSRSGHARHHAGHEGQEARPARLAHRRRLPRRLPRPRRATCSAARRSSTSASPAPARGASAAAQAAMQTFEATPADRRRPGARHRPRRLRVRAGLRQGARAVRPHDHREPVDRVHAGRHEDGDRRGAPARLARVVDGPHRAEVQRTPRAR